MAEKFIMVSLEEEKTKKLAEVISNDTARKLLNYLSDHEEVTVNEMSKELSLPVSTVDYNIKNLLKSGLVESTEFKWSSKGRQMDLYRLTNKHIIISAKKNFALREIFQQALPIILVGLVVSALIEFFTNKTYFITQSGLKSENVALEMAALADSAVPALQSIHYGLWFFFGVLFVVIFSLWLRKK